MAKKIIGIYMITCLWNRKRYIGQSIDIKRRFSQHKRNPPKQMCEDIKKYGSEAFTFEILEECAANEFDRKETEYILKMQPAYNIKNVGRGVYSNIVMLLKGKGRTAGGYHWIYADEDEEAQLERIRQMP